MSTVGFRDLIKILVRSRSLRFTADMVRQSPISSLARLRWSGRDVFYRSGYRRSICSISSAAQERQESGVYVPPGLRPETILDIGSNIGASILYFHRQFPTPRFSGSNLILTRFGYCKKMSRICLVSRFSTMASERLINALRSALIR